MLTRTSVSTYVYTAGAAILLVATSGAPPPIRVVIALLAVALIAVAHRRMRPIVQTVEQTNLAQGTTAPAEVAIARRRYRLRPEVIERHTKPLSLDCTAWLWVSAYEPDKQTFQPASKEADRRSVVLHCEPHEPNCVFKHPTNHDYLVGMVGHNRTDRSIDILAKDGNGLRFTIPETAGWPVIIDATYEAVVEVVRTLPEAH